METLKELQPKIIEWAKDRNILFPENAPKQRLKLIEECGELASAILKNDVKLQKDAVGDIFVVAVILSEQLNENIVIRDFMSKYNCFDEALFETLQKIIWSGDFEFFISDLLWFCFELNVELTECANIAWNEIKDRKGQTVDGTFIKQEEHRDGGISVERPEFPKDR